MKKIFKRGFTIFSMLTVVLSQTALFVPNAGAIELETTSVDKYTICHATESESNPWNRLNVPESSLSGHFDNSGTPLSGHEDDVLMGLDNANVLQCPGVQIPYPIPVVDANFHSGNTYALITWDEIFDDRLDGYKVVFSETNPTPAYPGDGYIKWETDSTVTSFDYAYNYLCDTDYYFSVTARYDNGSHLEVGNAITLNFACENPEPICGNGILEKPEQCDDGNTADGDGCSAQCTTELPPEPSCEPGGHEFDVDLYVMGENCTGPGWWYQITDSENINLLDDTATYSVYAEVHRSGLDETTYGQDNEEFTLSVNSSSDGPVVVDNNEAQTVLIQYAGDFDFNNGINTVQMDTSWYCDSSDTNVRNSVEVKKLCLYKEEIEEPICGNGILEKPEQCDDGNTENGDGCSAQCTIELPPEPICGNGILEKPEQCDDGNTENGDGCSAQCTIELPGEYIVKASKVVCDSEEDLPNWGAGNVVSMIDENTAADFVAQNEGCHLETDWEFQWGVGVSDPGKDFRGHAAAGWQDFDTKTATGTMAEVLIPGDLLASGSQTLKFREVLTETYLPFSYTGGDGNAPGSDFSAEFYCYNDVLNYDNYDYINFPTLGDTYYCVAFNVLEEPEDPAPWCSILHGLLKDYYNPDSNAYGIYNDVIDINDDQVINLSDVSAIATLYFDADDPACYKNFEDPEDEFHFSCLDYETIGWCGGLLKGIDDYYGAALGDYNYYPMFDLDGDDVINLSDLTMATQLNSANDQVGCYDHLVPPLPEMQCEEYSPYCGDGELNQEWEQCDPGLEAWATPGFTGCSYQCQFIVPPSECSDLTLAKVNIDDVQNWGNGNMTNDLFLGSSSYRIPNDVWFAVYWKGSYFIDPDIASYEEVEGLAVQRLEDSVRTVMYGTGTGNDKEHVSGHVEFYNATLEGQRSDDSNDNPGNNRLEKGFDGTGVGSYNAGNDEVSIGGEQSKFWLTTTSADDGYYSDWAIVEDCGFDPAPWCSILHGLLKDYYNPDSNAYGIYNDVIDINDDQVINLSDVSAIATLYFDADDPACYKNFEDPEDEFHFSCLDYETIGWCGGLTKGLTDYYGAALGDYNYYPMFDLDGDDVINLSDLSILAGLVSANDQVGCYNHLVPPLPEMICEDPKPYCGDGIVNNNEQCDGDDPIECTTDDGYTGTQSCNMPSIDPRLQSVEQLYCVWNECITNEYCGDQIVNGNEECDGTEDCTEICTYIVPPEPYCGDGNTDPGEQCDDGNNNNGDGCSAQCTTEGGPSSICGDGIVDSGEQCDDGNVNSGDGCSAQCTTEGGPSSICGDGTVDSGEQCDDGNVNSGDGCSAQCTTEGGPSSFTITHQSIDVATTTADVFWTTNKDSLTWITYGTSTDYSMEYKNDTFDASDHTRTLEDLEECTLYHYKEKGERSNGDSAQTGDMTFKTLCPQEVLGEKICEFDCGDIDYDLYIINHTDGSQRYMNTIFTQIEDLGNGKKLVKFEDKGLDFDYNDVIIEVDESDCTNPKFKLVSISAAWDHEVHVKIFYKGEFNEDVKLWPNDRSSIGKTVALENFYDADMCTVEAPKEVLGEKICGARHSGSLGPDSDVFGTLNFPENSLIREECGTTIYLIRDLLKHRITSPEVLRAYYQGKRVFNVTQEVLDYYPDGDSITMGKVRPAELGGSVAGVKLYGDGSLLRSPEHKIYLIKGKFKLYLNSLEDLQSYQGQTIYDVSDEVLDNYSTIYE